MKRALVTTGLAALLLLTGCTSTVTSETITVTPGASGTFSDGDTTVVVEPSASSVPAAPVEVTAAPEKTTAPQRDADDFLVRTQLALDNWGVTMNADQVRSAADYACDQIAAGVQMSDIVAITGEVPDYANGDFVDVVSQGYCPIR